MQTIAAQEDAAEIEDAGHTSDAMRRPGQVGKLWP